MGGSEQVLVDAAELVARTQATLTYQLASALQMTLLSFLDPAYTLAGVVLLCMYTECAARVQSKMDVSIARRVLLAQLGQSLMGAIDYSLTGAAATPSMGFLLRTCSLCLPSVLGSISPTLVSNDYVQNAISAYVYSYAQKSETMLRGVDMGAPPLYLCVLSIVLSRARVLQPGLKPWPIFTYVFQGWRMLFVDVLVRALADSARGAPKLARTALSLALVLAVDVLGLARCGMLQDVRGYAVFKTAEQLNSIRLLELDPASTCAVAVVLLCARSTLAPLLRQRGSAPVEGGAPGGERPARPLVTAAHSVADIVCVASVNVLLRTMMHDSISAAPATRFLLVCVVSVMAYTTQALLARKHT
jgi:hypothetical protein